LSRDNNNNNNNSNNSTAISSSILSMSDLCIGSGREACRLLIKLDSIGKFNAMTWWDVYYLYSSALVLVLSLICDVRESKTTPATETRLLLRQCTNLSRKYLATRCLPGTMHRWLNIVIELDSLASDSANRSTDQDASTSSEEDAVRNEREYVTPPSTDAGGSSNLPSGIGPLVRNPLALDHDLLGIWGPVSFDGNSPREEAGNGLMLLPWHNTHWEGIGDMLLNPDILRGW
jgi:hypothetical protein